MRVRSVRNSATPLTATISSPRQSCANVAIAVLRLSSNVKIRWSLHRQNAAPTSIKKFRRSPVESPWLFTREGLLHSTMPRSRRDYFSATLILVVLGITIAWTAFLVWLLLRLSGIIG
jgi:hypothetical protein